MLGTPLFGQLAFHCGLKNGGFIAFKIGLDALEVFDRLIQTGKLFLFFKWRNYDFY